MNGITHNQAIKWIHRRLDGLLTESQVLLLDKHLDSCDACRIYAAEMNLLPAHLQSEFHARWDGKPGPSPKVFEHVTAKARGIPMMNRIASGIKLFAGVAALVLLGFFINSVVSQLRNTSITATRIETVNVLPRAEDRLLAFASDQNGDFDIYTIRADGSGLTNLTNNPAQDVSPVWSPDGKRIAFESDRNGFRRIFLMDADGSNVVQLNENEEEADQWIGEPHNLSLNLWSPDGNKLIFYELAPGDEKGMLYIIDANGENKKQLVNETGKYSSPSWSPDEKHIAFITIENSVARIYITDANGNSLTNVTKALPSNETLYPLKYSWSRNGQSIAFIASNWNYLLGRGNEGTSTYKWTAYEASLDGNTLVANASAHSQMGGYWDGTYFLSGSAAVSSSPEFKWVHSDDTSTTANPIENCQKLLDSNTGDYITGYSSYKQSSNGNVVIGAYCPNGDKWLFWANSKGIFIPLLNSPIHVQSIPSNAMHLWAPPDFIWSSDDKYIAFNIFSAGKTDMYIVNVNDALQNPSIQPFHMAIGNSSLYYSPVWQPVSDNEVVEEKTTPSPDRNVSSVRLLVFASDQTGNSDIYTVHPDGSGMTNLTNDPSRDSNPIWSPGGTRIAFESDRDGFTQIYLMNADGSNVIQLTHGDAHHFLPMNIHGVSNPWSPDGNKLLFLGQEPGTETSTLYSLDITSGSVVMLANGTVQSNNISWSPDGKYVGYVLNDSPTPDATFVTGIYVVDAAGSNLIAINKLIPQIDSVYSPSYYWSRDESSIIFIAYRHLDEGRDQWIAYEAALDSNQLIERATSSTPMEDWWEGTSLIVGGEVWTLTWLRSDGTSNSLKPLEVCDPTVEANWGFLARRSPHGNQIINVACPNKDMWFYYASTDGTIIKPLMNSPIVSFTPGNTATSITWSADDQFIAVTQVSAEKSSLYILNVKEPSPQPEEILISQGEFYTLPSWRPMP